MLERLCQMADALVAHLARVAALKGDAAKAGAAAALTRDALLAGVHYFRVRDHIEQVRIPLGPGRAYCSSARPAVVRTRAQAVQGLRRVRCILMFGRAAGSEARWTIGGRSVHAQRACVAQRCSGVSCPRVPPQTRGGSRPCSGAPVRTALHSLAPPWPSLPHVAQLAAVELLPNFLAAHPAVRLVVVDSVTFHFRQVGCDRARPLSALHAPVLPGRGRERCSCARSFAGPTSPACTAEPA